MSYVQLALDTFEACRKTTAPLLELQQVLDDLLAFWGSADDYVEEEDCRNILKCGKYIEPAGSLYPNGLSSGYLEREYRKLCNRIVKTNLNYHSEICVVLKRLSSGRRIRKNIVRRRCTAWENFSCSRRTYIMGKLRFEYQMKLNFSSPVTGHYFALRCVPGDSLRQEITLTEFCVSLPITPSGQPTALAI